MMNLTQPAHLLCFLLALLALAPIRTVAADSDLVPVKALRADFISLYEQLQSAHADLYAQRAKAEYDARFEAELAALTSPMTRFDATLLFQRFTAFGNVGHARIEFPEAEFAAFRDGGGRTFPIYPRIVAGVAYVGTDRSGLDEIREGDRIVGIGDVAMATWLDRTAELISADTDYIAHSLLEFTFPKYLWALHGERDAVRLRLERDGRAFNVDVPFTTREAQSIAAQSAPDAFSLDTNTCRFEIMDNGIAYLRPGPFYNVENPERAWDTSAFVSFIDRSFEEILDYGADRLIIDLRQNPGGDNSFSDPMLAWIADEPFRFYKHFLIRSSDQAAAANAARLTRDPDGATGVSVAFAKEYERVPRGEVFPFELAYATPREGRRFEGQVYALVNRHSYSNAVNVAAIIQDYDMGIVVGEKTADMATTYGAMEHFTLANTGLRVGFPKAHIIRPSGDEKPDGVTPDWVIESPILPTTADTVLEKLLLQIGQN
ncbi:MAG: S41 family peptidase [Pseudomonadota bacterium]